MSIMNLLGSLATLDYETFYVVRSSQIDEARGRGAPLDSCIGTVKNPISSRQAILSSGISIL
jgi:hypothetical protein